MMMADRILNGEFGIPMGMGFPDTLVPSVRQRIREVMAEAIVFSADNVCEYYFGCSKDIWDVTKDFPNIAPPFASFFIEMKAPLVVNDGKETIPFPSHFRKMGALFYAQDAPHHEETQDSGGMRWHVGVELFMLTPLGLVWFGTVGLRINADGSPAANAEVLSASPSIREDKEIEHMYVYDCSMVVKPALLTICFLHCKNVRTVVHEQANVHRHQRKPPRTPRVRYHTLEINPMKEILQREGDAEESGLKHALHICRGHFKTFSGKGLFGKYKGTYWWDSFVRGSASEGVVLKDYSVSAPDPQSAPPGL